MGSFYNTEKGNHLVSVAILLLILVSIVVPARVYVRVRVVRSFGPDDWAIVIASVFGNAFCILVVVGMFFGFGEHIENVPPDEYKIGLIINWIVQLLYYAGICIAKISVSLFIRRISPYETYRKIAYFLIVFMTIYSVAMFLFTLTSYHPFNYTWNRKIQGGSNIITDFSLLALVVAMMWSIQMPRRQKYAVYGLFGLGTFASLASVIKVPYAVDFGKVGDYLYDLNSLALWSMVEVQAGIIATSLPTLKPLFRKYFKGRSGSNDPAVDSNEHAYPLEYFSSTSPNFRNNLATMDSEGEQHIVFNIRVQGTDVSDIEAGVVRGNNLTEKYGCGGSESIN